MERQTYLSVRAFRVFLGASILTALSSTLGNVVDGIIVSHLIDYNAMSATSLGKPIIQAYYTVYQLVGLGGSVLVAKAMGAGDMDRANRIFSTNAMVLAAFGAAMLFVGAFFIDNVVQLMCSNPELHDYARQYFRPLLLGAVSFMGVYFLGGYTAIDGAPRLVSAAMITDNLVNLGMDYVMVKYLEMGVTGSSVATVIGHVVACCILLTHYAGDRTKYRFSFSRWSHLGESCSTGLPFAVASVCMTVYLYATQFIIGHRLGADALFVFSVVLNIMALYNMFISGACSTMQQLAALQLGLNDYYGHRTTVSSAFRFLNTSLGTVCVLLLCFPQGVAGMFDCPDRLLPECCYSIRIYSVAFWLFCLLYLLMVNYKLLQRTALANVISFSLNLSVIPVIWLMAVLVPQLVWWSNLVAYGLVLLAALALSAAVRRRDKTLRPVSLLPTVLPFPTYDRSFRYSLETMNQTFEEITRWLTVRRLPEETVFRVRVVAEELMANIAEHGHRRSRKAFIDVRLLVQPEQVILSLADDSPPFNPVENKDKGIGLKIANGEASHISYKFQFGQNITTVTVAT